MEHSTTPTYSMQELVLHRRNVPFRSNWRISRHSNSWNHRTRFSVYNRMAHHSKLSTACFHLQFRGHHCVFLLGIRSLEKPGHLDVHYDGKRKPEEERCRRVSERERKKNFEQVISSNENLQYLFHCFETNRQHISVIHLRREESNVRGDRENSLLHSSTDWISVSSLLFNESLPFFLSIRSFIVSKEIEGHAGFFTPLFMT